MKGFLYTAANRIKKSSKNFLTQLFWKPIHVATSDFRKPFHDSAGGFQ